MFLANQCELYPALNDYAKGNIVISIAKKLLGRKIYLFNEQIVSKEPNTYSKFSWHQDFGYVGSNHQPYISIWLALDDTNESNGLSL